MPVKKINVTNINSPTCSLSLTTSKVSNRKIGSTNTITGTRWSTPSNGMMKKHLSNQWIKSKLHFRCALYTKESLMGWRSLNAKILMILIKVAVSRQLVCSIKANLTRAHFYGLWVIKKKHKENTYIHIATCTEEDQLTIVTILSFVIKVKHSM